MKWLKTNFDKLKCHNFFKLILKIHISIEFVYLKFHSNDLEGAEDTDDTDSHDAIFCEGTCDAWIRRCSGLSKTLFQMCCNYENSYHCLHCQLLGFETLTRNEIH